MLLKDEMGRKKWCTVECAPRKSSSVKQERAMKHMNETEPTQAQNPP